MFFHSEVTFRFVTCLHFNLLLQKRKIIRSTKPKRRDLSCVLVNLNLKEHFCFIFRWLWGGITIPMEI